MEYFPPRRGETHYILPASEGQSAVPCTLAPATRPDTAPVWSDTSVISVLGNEEAAKDTIQGLKSAVGFVRTQLAKRINLRNTPEITFILDQSIEYGVHMTRLIDEVTENLRDSESGDEEENE